jgi:transposase
MTADDKNIGGEVYTVISNKDTGKIAAMIMSVKRGIVSDVLLKKVPVAILMAVKTVTKDLAENYDWMARTCFMNAMKIADKFHVIKLAMEALQAIRIRFDSDKRSQMNGNEGNNGRKRRKQDERSSGYRSVRKRRNGKDPPGSKSISAVQVREAMDGSAGGKSKILFREFPEIKEAYDLICSFRNFYKCKIGTGHRARESLDRWYEKTKKTKIEEIKNFRHTVKRHEGEIMNYFEEGHTNAFAESLNNKIQSFVRSNYGIRDRDFFHFRLMKMRDDHNSTIKIFKGIAKGVGRFHIQMVRGLV